MTLTIPNTFGTQSGTIPVSQIDDNFAAVKTNADGMVLIGTLAARPAASTDGRYYFATDDRGGTMYRDNGSAWVQVAASVASGAGGAIPLIYALPATLPRP